MTLDEICTRPGAGAALLNLHRWLPQHGAFAMKQAFKGCAIEHRINAAGAGLTAFTVLARLAEILRGAPASDRIPLTDRALMMLSRAGEFELVRDFLAMDAALTEADARHRAAGRGGLREGFEATERHLWAAQQFCLALGIPLNVKITYPDGRTYTGGQP